MLDQKKVNMNELVSYLILLGFTIILTIQNIGSPISHRYPYSDYSIYQYLGKVMNEGQMVYRDVFEHKGPFFVILNAIGYKLNAYHGMWLMELPLTFLSMVLAYKIACNELSKKMALIAVIISMSGISAWGYWIGNTPESMALIFYFVPMYYFIQYFYKKDLRRIEIVIVGCSFSFAILMKPTFAIIYIGLVLGIIIDCIFTKNNKLLGKCILWFSVPCIVIITITVLWLYFNNALYDCYEQYFVFNMEYSKLESDLGMAIAAGRFLSMPISVMTLGCISVIWYWWAFYSEVQKKIAVYTVITLLLTFYISALPGRSYQQYTLLFYPMIITLVSLALSNLNIRKGFHSGSVLIILLLLTYWVAIPNFRMVLENARVYTSEIKEQTNLVDYINSTYLGDYEISVVTPDDAWVYLYTGHNSATRFSFSQAQMIRRRIMPQFFDEYVEEINNNKPRLIIATINNNLFEQEIKDRIDTEYFEVYTDSKYIIYELSNYET